MIKQDKVNPVCTAIVLGTLVGTPHLSASQEGDYINQAIERARRSMDRSVILGIEDLLEELEELVEECGTPGWDGYDANPISQIGARLTVDALRALPPGVAKPSLGVEADGQFTIEWYVSPDRTLSVSISPDGELHYAALVGTSRHFGTEPFVGHWPKRIIGLVYRISAV